MFPTKSLKSAEFWDMVALNGTLYRYKHFEHLLTRHDAKKICHYYDAQLPNPQSTEENQFLANLGTTWLSFKQINLMAKKLKDLHWNDIYT